MTMQRRHFELIAETLKEHREFTDDSGRETLNFLSKRFAYKLGRTNPNFNEVRFLRACGVTDA